jgi:uncharacterized protein (TIGR01777 family)
VSGAGGLSTLSVTVTGATGLIGRALTRALREAGAQVTVLSRDPARARAAPGAPAPGELQALAWDPSREPAPAAGLAGRDAVVHLAGENIAQRWTDSTRREIGESRVRGTENLIAGLAAAEPRPRALLSASAVGYYGARGEEPIDEDAPAGGGFLARVCVAWEAQARRAEELGMRVATPRFGVVLDRRGGALAQMLTPFRLGLGGPIAGGRQYISWIHSADLVATLLAALRDERWSGPINATAPEPVTNREFTRALGRALGRPARMPIPAVALRLRYGEMAQTVTTGVRALPARALMLGFEFRHPQLQGALQSILAGG